MSKAEHGQNPQNNKYFGVKESNATEEVRIIHKKIVVVFCLVYRRSNSWCDKIQNRNRYWFAEKIPMFLVIWVRILICLRLVFESNLWSGPFSDLRLINQVLPRIILTPYGNKLIEDSTTQQHCITRWWIIQSRWSCTRSRDESVTPGILHTPST